MIDFMTSVYRKTFTDINHLHLLIHDGSPRIFYYQITLITEPFLLTVFTSKFITILLYCTISGN